MERCSAVVVSPAGLAFRRIGVVVAFLFVLGTPTAVLSQCTYTPLEYGEMYDIVGAQTGDEYFYQVVHSSSSWTATAVRSAERSVDPNLLLYPDWTGVPPCVSGDLLAESSLGSGYVDFVVLDYNQLAPGAEYYVMVDINDGSGDCNVEWADGWLELNGISVYSLYFGASAFLVDVVNVYLTAGTTYRFEFDCDGTEVRMCLFYGGRGAWGSRSDAEFEVGCGQPYQEYTAPASQMYGIVLFNEGGGGGMFEVGPIVNTPVERQSWGTLKALYR